MSALVVLGTVDEYTSNDDGSVTVSVPLSLNKQMTPLFGVIKSFLKRIPTAHAQLPILGNRAMTVEETADFLKTNEIGTLSVSKGVASIRVPADSRAVPLIKRGIFHALTALIDDMGVQLVSLCDRINMVKGAGMNNAVCVYKRNDAPNVMLLRDKMSPAERREDDFLRAELCTSMAQPPAAPPSEVERVIAARKEGYASEHERNAAWLSQREGYVDPPVPTPNKQTQRRWNKLVNKSARAQTQKGN